MVDSEIKQLREKVEQLEQLLYSNGYHKCCKCGIMIHEYDSWVMDDGKNMDIYCEGCAPEDAIEVE